MAAETTVTSAKAWAIDTTIPADDAVPDALILATSTVAGRVEGDAVAVRVQYVDDAAAALVAEGDVIPESDPDLSERLVFTTKVSQLVRFSAEQWNQPNASELMSNSVRRAVTRTGDAAYINQAAPVAPAVTPPAGLLNVAGILDGGAVAGNLDALVDLQASVAAVDAEPTHWVLSPTAWASLRKIKRQTGSAESILGTGAADAVAFLLDVPVLVSSAVPPDTGLLVDKTAVVSAVGDVMVATSEHAYFASDAIGLRCTWRIGANVVKPERIGKFTVTDPTP